MYLKNIIILLLLIFLILDQAYNLELRNKNSFINCEAEPETSQAKFDSNAPFAKELKQSNAAKSPVIVEPSSDLDNNKSFETIAQWKVEAISNLVSLNEDQRHRLKRKFLSEHRDRSDPISESETLEEILGSEAMNIYLESKSRAKAKVKSEHLEKDVLYIARRLSLNLNDEEHLRAAIFLADEQVELYLEQARKDPHSKRDPYQNFANYLESEKLRRQIISAEAKKFLSAEAFKEYLKLEADSAAVEIEMWHGG